MYVATVPNRKSPPAILIRESYRVGGKVKTRTLANISHLPQHVTEIIRRALKGHSFVSTDEPFEKVESWHHGHVDAVIRAMKRVGFASLIDTKPSRQRDLVIAMVAGRILEPDNEQNSKLANTRWWKITTLPQMLEIDSADQDDLYDAMDWVLERQDDIENKLAGRHLQAGGMVLYDLTSSYFEGTTCPLAALGYSRDGKKGKLQVNYGLLTDGRGCPVSVSVFEGNISDSETVTEQTTKVKERFGIEEMVFVGDRGMISQKLIDEVLRDSEGIAWITALKSGAIRKLVTSKHLQLGLFDERNLFEFTAPDKHPGERLVACRNPELAKLRGHKRQSLLEATAGTLREARRVIEGGKLRGIDRITCRLEKVAKSYKVNNDVTFKVHDEGFIVRCADGRKAAMAAFDGVHKELRSIRRSIKRGKLSGQEKIAKRITKVVAKYDLAKHTTIEIHDDEFEVHVQNPDVAVAAALQRVFEKFQDVRTLVDWGRYGGKGAIGVRVGKVLNKYKVAKHFVLSISDDGFDFHIDEEKVAAEAALDGVYVIRTSVSSEKMDADDAVRNYKSLSQVERAFRSLKTVDLKVRPIRHRLEKRVRAHIFLCMLAYYVEWHMREAWRPLLFADEDQEAKKTRDPVAPAKRSDEALSKAHSKQLDDGTTAHSFQTLLKLLSQIVRNECRLPGSGPEVASFAVMTTPTEKQQLAYELLETIKM